MAKAKSQRPKFRITTAMKRKLYAAYQKHCQDAVNKAVRDSLVFGEGTLKITPDGMYYIPYGETDET